MPNFYTFAKYDRSYVFHKKEHTTVAVAYGATWRDGCGHFARVAQHAAGTVVCGASEVHLPCRYR